MINDAVTAVRTAVDTINDRSIGDRAAARPARARPPAAGSAVFIYRAADGRLAEAWQLVNGLALYRLAGLIDWQNNSPRQRNDP